MFRAEQLTDGDRQRRRVRQLHALPIRQTAATTGENRRRTREPVRNAPSSPEMQEKLQEKEFPCALHTIIRTHTDSAAVQSCKIGAKMQGVCPGAMTTTRGVHHPPGIRGGEVYNSEGQKGSTVRRNSPSRLHVPFYISYMVISTRKTDVEIYQQVGGEGGGFETGSKKRNGQKIEGEK